MGALTFLIACFLVGFFVSWVALGVGLAFLVVGAVGRIAYNKLEKVEKDDSLPSDSSSYYTIKKELRLDPETKFINLIVEETSINSTQLYIPVTHDYSFLCVNDQKEKKQMQNSSIESFLLGLLVELSGTSQRKVFMSSSGQSIGLPLILLLCRIAYQCDKNKILAKDHPLLLFSLKKYLDSLLQGMKSQSAHYKKQVAVLEIMINDLDKIKIKININITEESDKRGSDLLKKVGIVDYSSPPFAIYEKIFTVSLEDEVVSYVKEKLGIDLLNLKLEQEKYIISKT